MKTEKNNRIHFHGLRLTEEEEILLRSRMESASYKSVSRYMRDAALGRDIIVPRKIRMTDRGLRDQLNAVNTQLQRIGVNYNQVVATVNALAKRTDAKGNPVMNSASLELKLDRLYKITLKIPTLMQTAIDVVKSAENRIALRDTN